MAPLALSPSRHLAPPVAILTAVSKDGILRSPRPVWSLPTKRAGVLTEEIEAFRTESTAGDCDTLLQAVMRWVDVE